MAWRLAKSLQVLRSEIRSLHPGTTVWDIGDAAHRASASDHNPNAAGVVCAVDVLADGGLNLGEFAEHVKRTNHRAVKYIIYNRRIWSKERDEQGWRSYHGSNPHSTHVHVSVGVGPDGRSTGPYDDTSSWGLEDEVTKDDIKAIAEATVKELMSERIDKVDASSGSGSDMQFRSYIRWIHKHSVDTKLAVLDRDPAEFAAALAPLLPRGGGGAPTTEQLTEALRTVLREGVEDGD